MTTPQTPKADTDLIDKVMEIERSGAYLLGMMIPMVLATIPLQKEKYKASNPDGYWMMKARLIAWVKQTETQLETCKKALEDWT